MNAMPVDGLRETVPIRFGITGPSGIVIVRPRSRALEYVVA